jgi:hypothetical protein
MEEATTNLSATEITQLTGLIVGEGFKRMANKTETVKRFVNVLEANATGDILQIAKEILGEADFNHASKRLASVKCAALFAALPMLEGRRHWLKCGSLKVEATKKNLQALNLLPGLEVREVSEVASEELLEEFELAPQPFRYKTTPFNHQVRAMEKILSPREYPNVFALFLEQGLGKTKTLIDWAGMLHAEKKISGVLVVSKKGVHRQWVESELPAHSAAESQTFTWPFKPEELDKKPGFQWAAFNIDGIKTKKGLEVATLFAKRHSKRLMIIVDESQEIKNHRTQRWKALEGLKKYSSHRAIATGTPIAKDFCDEWAQLRWLEEGILGIRYITAFKAEFCILGGYGRHKDNRRAADRSRNHIRGISRWCLRQRSCARSQIVHEQRRCTRPLGDPLFRRNRPKSPRALQQCALLFAQLQGPR